MSESIKTKCGHTDFRHRLLAGTSAFALVSFTCASDIARADDDTDRSTIWIELGAQLEQANGFGNPFAPHFMPEVIADGFTSPLRLQHHLSQSFGEEGAISFQPENSDWVLSASVRYGRATGSTKTHQQTPVSPKQLYLGTYKLPTLFTPNLARYSEVRAANDETHAILDFQAGRDIGLGLLGHSAKSTINFGVRFAQFTSAQTLGMNADPDYSLPAKLTYSRFHHVYTVGSHIQRSFRGFGPSLSWNASAPVIGNTEQGMFALDWGVNAAVLFGRQKAIGHHQTVGTYFKKNLISKYQFTSHIHRSGNPDRSRVITVPNIGGFAGLSYVFPNAKLSIGYRADLFFGAMDGGIDAAKKENVGFYGPFASISVGLGG
jgi:iron complex outermembrane receptor protein